MKLFDIASEIESAVFQCEQMDDLMTIVLTEVFDECKATDDDYFGKLLPYEHSFERRSCISSFFSTMYSVDDKPSQLKRPTEP